MDTIEQYSPSEQSIRLLSWSYLYCQMAEIKAKLAFLKNPGKLDLEVFADIRAYLNKEVKRQATESVSDSTKYISNKALDKIVKEARSEVNFMTSDL